MGWYFCISLFSYFVEVIFNAQKIPERLYPVASLMIFLFRYKTFFYFFIPYTTAGGENRCNAGLG